MAPQPFVAQPPPHSPARPVRAEYIGFENVDGYREYRFTVCGPDGPAALRFRIATAAFAAGRVLLQDGPDVCYQKLLRVVAAGETNHPEVDTIDDGELTTYRAAHTRVPKHRSVTPGTPQKPQFLPRPPRPLRSPARVAPLAAPVVAKDAAPSGFEEGRRVSHAVFGVGVTTSSGRGHTVIQFDKDGPRTFITSMLKLEVLSAPQTWETGRGGKNRPRETR